MSLQEEYYIGENPCVDLREPLREHAQKIVDNEKSANTAMELGAHGLHYLHSVDKIEPDETEGHLRIHLKHAKDPMVVIPIVVTVGAVIAGIAHLKHRK